MWNSGANTSFAFGSQPQGFLNPNESPNTGLSQDEKQRKFRTQTIVPVTLGFLHETMKESDTPKMGEMEITNVLIVGLVISVEQKTTHIAYIVDDMTGPPINIQHWMDDSNDQQVSNRTPMVEGTYIQVCGSVKKIKDQLNIIVFKIKAITNLNFLTMHLLEVMDARKMLEFELKNIGSDKMDGFASGIKDNGEIAMEVDNPVGVPEGLSKIQAVVYKTIQNCKFASGCTVEWLREQLPAYNSASIGQAMSFLCDEGHVYTTVDDYHFQVTEIN